MTVTTQERGTQARYVTTTPRRQASRKKVQPAPTGSLVTHSLKASLIGGFVISLLLLISLIDSWYLACLVIPGFLVVWLNTGLLAGVFAGDAIRNSHQGGKVGWLAGFWAGVFGGLVAMIMAALGVIMVNFGQGIVSQLAPEQLAWLMNYGVTGATVALVGRVFGALIVYGVIGSLVSGLVSSIGGMIYPKLVGNTSNS